MDRTKSRKTGRIMLTFAMGVALAACSAPVFGPANVRPVYRDGSHSAADIVSDSYASGRAAYAAGHYGLAIQAFERELGRYPRSIRALNGLGAAYDGIGRFDIARAYYFEALALAPDDTRTLNNLGYSNYLAGRYAEASKLLALAEALSGGRDAVVNGNLRLSERAQGRSLAANDETGAAAAGAPSRSPALKAGQARTVITVPAMPKVRLEVSNGNGRTGMAKLVTRVLKRMGGQVHRITNADTFAYPETLIYYQPGNRAQAEELAGGLPVPVELAETQANRPDIKVRLVLGHDIAGYFSKFEAIAHGRG